METQSKTMTLVAVVLLLASVIDGSNGAYTATLTPDEQEVGLVLGEADVLLFCLSGNLSQPANFSIAPPSKEVLEPLDGSVQVQAGDFWDSVCYNVSIQTIHEGQTTLRARTDSDEIDVRKAFVVVAVQKDPAYETAGMVLGWISTIAWDFSFLPQIWHNYRRRNVSGLSFDFLTFNLLGFSCYFLFNAGLYWNTAIQEQYTIRHPDEVLHVRINDVVFPMYAVICTVVQIIQCFFYTRAPGQRVSLPCTVISSLLLAAVVIDCILVPIVDNVLWIDVLYLMSYVKLAITMIKYIPQLYTNYKAQSTAGWNIFQVILDFTGGFLSIVQMFLIAVNYDDIHSVLSDPTKLGLGLLSMFFNVFFMLQHYWLYRGNDDPLAAGQQQLDDSKETVKESERF